MTDIKTRVLEQMFIHDDIQAEKAIDLTLAEVSKIIQTEIDEQEAHIRNVDMEDFRTICMTKIEALSAVMKKIEAKL